MLTASYCRPQRIGSKRLTQRKKKGTAIEHHVAKRCNLFIYFIIFHSISILVCKSTTQFLSLFILCALTFSLPCRVRGASCSKQQTCRCRFRRPISGRAGTRQTLLGPQHTKVGCRHLTSRRELRQQHTQAQWFLQKVLTFTVTRVLESALPSYGNRNNQKL